MNETPNLKFLNCNCGKHVGHWETCPAYDPNFKPSEIKFSTSSEMSLDFVGKTEIDRLTTRIAELEKENQKLKDAAEMEFQKAEGKAEMKRWFQEQLQGERELCDKLMGALKTIIEYDPDNYLEKEFAIGRAALRAYEEHRKKI